MFNLYLSSCNISKCYDLSSALISQNGWKDQFTITSKVLNQFAAVLGDLSLGKSDDYTLRKEFADAIFVAFHIINQEQIKIDELYDVGFNGYNIHGEKKIGKVPRTYSRVLGVDNYKPSKDYNKELILLAKRVMTNKVSEHGQCGGQKYQLGISIEEITEVNKELSRRKRGKENREETVEETFDMLYTFLYPKLIKNISKAELNKFMSFRLPQIQAREITFKKR
ncbi:MAG: hypothetical protein JW985_02890 [Alphaproteobacteria bacterium]|nr:hypothetical protein [Alphaproteobacteria bacterium]